MKDSTFLFGISALVRSIELLTLGLLKGMDVPDLERSFDALGREVIRTAKEELEKE